jgi:hypothetical protein
MLFGFGMAIQMGRAQFRGGGFVRTYVRRLLVLLLISAMHITLPAAHPADLGGGVSGRANRASDRSHIPVARGTSDACRIRNDQCAGVDARERAGCTG